jgi:hypothetical protein
MLDKGDGRDSFMIDKDSLARSVNRDGRIMLDGLIILFCGSFLETVADCCPDCHRSDRSNLISLNPRKDGGSEIDFSLPIQGLVCCRTYDMARAKTNAFWLAEVKKRGHARMTGFDRPVYTPALPVPSRRTVTERKRPMEEEEVPSMEDFLWSIRRPKR